MKTAVTRPSETPQVDPVATPEPAVTTPAAPSLSLTDSWTDSNGYSYKLTLDTLTSSSTTDTANALPGKADVSYTYTASGTLENTTAQRNAPYPVGALGPSSILVEPVWTAGAPACSGSNTYPAWSSNTPGRADAHCTVVGTPLTVEPTTPDSSGSAQDIPMNGSVAVSATFTNSTTVAQSAAPATSTSLNTPTLWALGRADGAGLLQDCLLASGGIYLSVSTAPTGCTAQGQ